MLECDNEISHLSIVWKSQAVEESVECLCTRWSDCGRERGRRGEVGDRLDQIPADWCCSAQRPSQWWTLLLVHPPSVWNPTAFSKWPVSSAFGCYSHHCQSLSSFNRHCLLKLSGIVQ